MLNTITEFRDPIHGYVFANSNECAIIDTPIFQRLRQIRQLSGTYLTYPGAQHTRFDHSLGSMHLAGIAGDYFLNKDLIDKELRNDLRMSALLHDIGHGPFSHLIEEVMTEKSNITHEDIARKVIHNTEIKDILNLQGHDHKRISELAVGLSKNRSKFVNDLMTGGLSVDVMDYLLRDSHFTGVEYGKVDVHRVINSFEIFEDSLALNQAAQYAFEALVISRFEMFRAVYFHRTVRAAEIMLIRSISLADDLLHLTDISDLDRYLALTDEITLEKLSELETSGNSSFIRAKKLAMDYKSRKLLKCVFEKPVHRKDLFLDRIFNQKKFRTSIAHEIAADADVEPEDVYLDVPTTPSVPLTSSHNDLSSIVLVSKEYGNLNFQRIPVTDIPLLSSISGYFNVMRVYTTSEHRNEVERATKKFFDNEEYSK